jgi:thiol-disulfide isomerase/thioredoxin
MDRLSTLIAVAALVGCNTRSDPAGEPPARTRTDTAKVKPAQAASTDAFCDVHAGDAGGDVFHWPELAPGGTAPAGAGGTGWQWVNVWATWCKPCIAEMPRITAQRDKLVAAGRRVALTFVSTDDSDAEVAEFRKAHPELPGALRIAGNNQRIAWLRSLHLSDGAIPINLFVSPAGRLRCARAGEIREQDLAMVDRLLAE